ncbi:MAG: sterol desaturase family protein [Pseudomonadota bacterium]
MSTMRTLIKYGLQPTVTLVVLALWASDPESLWLFPAVLVGLQLLLGVLEVLYPRQRSWIQGPSEKAVLVTVFFVTGVFGVAAVEPLYAETVRPALDAIRAALGLDVWPHQWPLMLQALLAFFLSEFIWYWIHRAEHRWHGFWRLSGHGSHHAFHNLNAINATANHPLEILLVLSLPAAIVELVFGAGAAIGGSVLLLITQAFMAHANLDLNTRVIGWLFTVNRYHIHHHSAVLAESNTNFGCGAIVWDRLFGTFSDADTQQTGTGPTQPSLWRIFLMPYREPEDTQTAPPR